jgi:outer membrane immunogenic protein
MVSTAAAADLPLKSRPLAPVAVESGWGGFYAGVSIGYYNLGGNFYDVDNQYFDNSKVDVRRDGQGGVVGAQIGYNWQSGAFVWGVEVEALANLGSLAQSGPGDAEGCGVPDSSHCFSADQKGSLSIKGRLGYLVTPATLLYVTGGGSWAGFRHDHYDDNLRGSNNDLYWGWTVGGGLEQKMTQHASLRLEGRYKQYEKKTWFDQSDEEFGLRPDLDRDPGANYKF